MILCVSLSHISADEAQNLPIFCETFWRPSSFVSRVCFSSFLGWKGDIIL